MASATSFAAGRYVFCKVNRLSVTWLHVQVRRQVTFGNGLAAGPEELQELRPWHAKLEFTCILLGPVRRGLGWRCWAWAGPVCQAGVPRQHLGRGSPPWIRQAAGFLPAVRSCRSDHGR